MNGRVTMAESIDFFNLAFAESRNYLGLDGGDGIQEKFDRLIEASWDLGCIGVSDAELDETVYEHGFDPNTHRGFNVSILARSMYDRSLLLHRTSDYEGAETIS